MPIVEGISYRTRWSARVVDFAALVRAAAGHEPWIALLKPDQRALDAQARSLQARCAIPGVEVVRARDVAVRGTP